MRGGFEVLTLSESGGVLKWFTPSVKNTFPVYELKDTFAAHIGIKIIHTVNEVNLKYTSLFSILSPAMTSSVWQSCTLVTQWSNLEVWCLHGCIVLIETCEAWDFHGTLSG